MQLLSVPTETPFFIQRVTLDGRDYILRFEWNMRSGWYLGMADQDDDVIFAPKKLVADWDILAAVTDDRRPRGMLLCLDMSMAGTDPTLESMGSQHKIAYFTEAEKAELIASLEE